MATLLEFDMANTNGISYQFELVGKTVLYVEREGQIYTKVATSPDHAEFRFTSGTGKVEFENLFTMGAPWISEIKKVKILYK